MAPMIRHYNEVTFTRDGSETILRIVRGSPVSDANLFTICREYGALGTLRIVRDLRLKMTTRATKELDVAIEREIVGGATWPRDIVPTNEQIALLVTTLGVGNIIRMINRGNIIISAERLATVLRTDISLEAYRSRLNDALSEQSFTARPRTPQERTSRGYSRDRVKARAQTTPQTPARRIPDQEKGERCDRRSHAPDEATFFASARAKLAENYAQERREARENRRELGLLDEEGRMEE